MKEPLELVLDDLLHMQQNGELYMDLDYVSLNINLLIHFLNTNFLVNKK